MVHLYGGLRRFRWDICAVSCLPTQFFNGSLQRWSHHHNCVELWNSQKTLHVILFIPSGHMILSFFRWVVHVVCSNVIFERTLSKSYVGKRQQSSYIKVESRRSLKYALTNNRCLATDNGLETGWAEEWSCGDPTFEELNRISGLSGEYMGCVLEKRERTLE